MEEVGNVPLLKGRGILTDTRDCLIGNKLAPPPVGWCAPLDKLVLMFMDHLKGKQTVEMMFYPT